MGCVLGTGRATAYLAVCFVLAINLYRGPDYLEDICAKKRYKRINTDKKGKNLEHQNNTKESV